MSTNISTKKIIFAVDDKAAMRHIYQTILGDDFNLHCFTEPIKMLKMADSIRPDLAIIDIGLGEMTGYEVCHLFKHKEAMEMVPVVFVTGRDFSQDKGQAFFSGGSEYVTKPISVEPFLALVARLIEDHGQS